MWGLLLGKAVGHLRSGHHHKGKREELLQIGFSFDSQLARFTWDQVCMYECV